MARVETWFHEWVDEHIATHPRVDWPDPLDPEKGSRFFAAWRSAFVRHGLGEKAIMTEASERLAANPPRHVNDHLPALLKLGSELYKARQQAGESLDPNSRDCCRLASPGCEYCPAEGLTIVHASRPDPERRISETSAAYCVCPMGRWVERTHREKSPDVYRRIPDLTNVLAHRSFWRLDPTWMTAAQGSRNPDPALVPPDCSRTDRPDADVAATIRGWIASAATEPPAVAPKPFRKPEWMAPVPADLPMPKPVPREVPPPGPVPAPKSAVGTMDEEDYSWI